jgi:hypothetical protein
LKTCFTNRVIYTIPERLSLWTHIDIYENRDSIYKLNELLIHLQDEYGIVPYRLIYNDNDVLYDKELYMNKKDDVTKKLLKHWIYKRTINRNGSIEKFKIYLFIFDTIGLGVFTLIGLEKGINIGLHPIICIALGTMTACFGGVIRDIICAEIPVIFRKEIYATICILGGIVFFILRKFNLNSDVLYLTTSLVIISVRVMAVRFKWCLPTLNKMV